MQATPASIEHHDCRQIAAALDGLAGTLQSGFHVDAKDLRATAEAAQWVWDAGPAPAAVREAEFRDAREHYDAASAGCANGIAKDASVVEREARRMARELRLMGAESLRMPVRRELPRGVDATIHGLVKRFAHNAGARAA